ncbi:MAG: TerB family tellurite resistance protein [Alphaproteobacteria bacterium]|nr:TerB family tellurite resistance protein [Alphaproteobacteria bacterium]
MLERLMSFLQGDALPPVAAWRREDVEVAAAALLVEAARVDGQMLPAERATIVQLLGERFGLDAAGAEALLAHGIAADDQTVQLHRFATLVNRRFTEEERVELIEMLWAVVYADGVLSAYEANLLRRIGGLLYVDDRDRGAARQRVLARLGRSEPGNAG